MKPRAALLAIGIAVAVPSMGVPQDTKAPADGTAKDKEPKAKWLPVLHQHATEYEITATPPGEGAPIKAEKLRDPLMRWTQPVRGGDDGVLCLWVDKGRPVVAMTIFTFRADDGNRWVVHEHQSLSTLPLQASWQGRPMWHTTGPGLTFAEVPDAPAPAATPAARLRQMQAISRDFSGETYRNGSTWALRPLAKPLYRYEKTGPEVIDGALFALVQGNDPEAFVLIEARPDTRDPKLARWYFATARLTDLQMKVRRKDREVLSVEHTIGEANAPYQTSVTVKKPSDNPEDFARP